MNISYDIFELTDCPVILTDKDFTVIYKNRMAAKFFTFRKRSKLIRHFRNFENGLDFSNINELDIETGTQFMRALVVPLKSGELAFLFFSLYAFTDTKKLLEYVRAKFSGNFIDFYCAAYRALTAENNSFCTPIPERAYSELITLISFFAERPIFMQKEIHDLSALMNDISAKIAKSLSVFGLKASVSEIMPDCYSEINLRSFCFILFRMIYMAFRLSDTGKIQISLNTPRYSIIDICVFTHTKLESQNIKTGDFSSIADVFPEFSFEFDILKQTGFLNNTLSFSLENSTLKLHYLIKRETGPQLTLRTESGELRKKRISLVLSQTLALIKKLFKE